MKKIVIATDSYKESLDGLEVANNIKIGMEPIISGHYTTIGIADGGEGTTASLINSTEGTSHTLKSVDGLGRELIATIGLDNSKTTAFIEMAASSGIEHIEPQLRNPLITNTYGTGLMIKEAINLGVSKIIIGIGGSVTNDVGIGMLSALGVQFFDQENNLIEPIGANLQSIATIDTTNLIDLSSIKIEVACDVENTLYGPNGATYVYGKQKGATPQVQDQLEAGVISFAKVLDKTFNTNSNAIIGGGAAGGLGAALAIVLNASLKPGFEIIAQLLNLEHYIQNADLVITGEGRMDSQSVNGKGPIGVAKLAKQYNVPCIAICGAIEDIEATYEFGVTAAFSIVNGAQSLDSALANTENNLRSTSNNIARIIKTII